MHVVHLTPSCLGEQVKGRFKPICECSISMEKDQSLPLFNYDKPGADPDEADFEDEDAEEF